MKDEVKQAIEEAQTVLAYVAGRWPGVYGPLHNAVTLLARESERAESLSARVAALEEALMLMRGEAPPCDTWHEDTVAAIRALDTERLREFDDLLQCKTLEELADYMGELPCSVLVASGDLDTERPEVDDDE